MASSRWAFLICSTCSSVSFWMSGKSSEAAMIVAVVEAIPFWVKVRLYGCCRPGQVVEQVLAHGDRELVSAQVLAVVGEPVLGVQRLEVDQLVGHLVVVLQGVHQRDRLDAHAPWPG